MRARVRLRAFARRLRTENIIIEHFIMENIIIVVRSQITDIDGTVL